MTPEEKQLLLRDLCARLPYGVKAKIAEEGVLSYDSGTGVIVGKEHVDNEIFIIQCKNDSWCLTAISEFVPYLRPMSSMTMDERCEYDKFINSKSIFDYKNAADWIRWMNEHHFDYNGLIDMGLALEAPGGMYNI